jgi:PAS domain S-box-containing protein
MRNAADSPAVSEQILMSKRELETVFDVIPEMICIINKEFKIVRVNKSFSSFTGLSIKELLGQNCHKIFWHRDEVCSDCPAVQSFTLKREIIKKPMRCKNGEDVRHFEVSTFPVFNESGGTHVIEFTRDLTDEKRVLEQLIRSEKLAGIGIMTAGIAHEMNNPLSGISGTALNLLEKPEKYGLNEKGISRVNAILESSARATTIMRDLLHISRKHDSTRIMANINSLILKTINAIHLQGAEDIKRTLNLDDSLSLITCDPSKIEQVIINIITNAMQSVIEKKNSSNQSGKEFEGRILITTQRRDDDVLITISDNGIGIPENIRSKIFDPFFSTRPAGQGTGLGLSISHKIIEEHGGKIFFECMDESTTFSIILPLERKN